MKILFTFSGLPHYYNLVLSRLNEIKNYEVLVVVPQQPGKTIGAGVYETTAGADFKIIKLEQYKGFYGKPFFKGIEDVIRKEKPDIIITAWPYIVGFWAYSRLRKLKKELGFKLLLKEIPFNMPRYEDSQRFYFSDDVYPDENLTPQKLKKNLKNRIYVYVLTSLRKKYLGFIDGVAAYIEEAKEIFGSYGVPEERIFLTYNSPDTDYLLKIKEELKSEPETDYNPYRLIHVGRLVKWKRVDLLIHAVKELQKRYPEVELFIAGTGPEDAALKKLASELGLSGRVRFLGGVYDTKELGRYLMSSGIYVLAGMGGLSINEAMSFGKPVICSVCDGTEKLLVADGENGLYFKRDDLTDLISKIDVLLSDKDMIKNMGMRSEEIIRTKININNVITGYTKAFNKIINV